MVQGQVARGAMGLKKTFLAIYIKKLDYRFRWYGGAGYMVDVPALSQSKKCCYWTKTESQRHSQNHRIAGLEETFKSIKSNPCPNTSTTPWH